MKPENLLLDGNQNLKISDSMFKSICKRVVQTLKTQEVLNNALREANNATQNLVVSQAKLNALRTRGTMELNPREQAEVEISAATTKFEIALREAKLKQAMIDAESKLLVKRLFVLAKETGDTAMLNADGTDLEAGLKSNLTHTNTHRKHNLKKNET